MTIHRLLLHAASMNLSSTASVDPSGSTTEDRSYQILLGLGYFAVAASGILVLIIALRFMCRRIDACITTPEERQARGTPAVEARRELSVSDQQLRDPFIRHRPRSCLSRLFCAQTTGGALKDLAVSTAEGIIVAFNACQR